MDMYYYCLFYSVSFHIAINVGFWLPKVYIYNSCIVTSWFSRNSYMSFRYTFGSRCCLPGSCCSWQTPPDSDKIWFLSENQFRTSGNIHSKPTTVSIQLHLYDEEIRQCLKVNEECDQQTVLIKWLWLRFTDVYVALKKVKLCRHYFLYE